MLLARNRTHAVLLAATVVVGCLATWAAVDVLTTASNQCDNMAGTCLHERQKAAILGVQVLCAVAAAVPLAGLVYVIGRVKLTSWWGVVLVPCALVAVAALVSDPVHHLNNRWDGWLGGNPP